MTTRTATERATRALFARRRRALYRWLCRRAGLLDGRALALREDLGALVMAIEAHASQCPDTHRGPGIPLDWHVKEARRSLAAYDHTRNQ